MPKRFKERIDFSRGLLDVARARVNDVPRPIESGSIVDSLLTNTLSTRAI